MSSGSDLSDALDSVVVAPRERAGGRRAAAAKAKFDFVSLKLDVAKNCISNLSIIFRMIQKNLASQTQMKNLETMME